MTDEAPPPKAKKKKSRFTVRAEYMLYRVIARIADSGDNRRARRMGERLGAFASVVLKGRSRMAMRNLAKTFPEKSDEERRQILRQCWRHFGRVSMDFLRFRHLTREQLQEICVVDGWEKLDRAIAMRRGVLLLSAHFGNWELGGSFLAMIGLKTTTVARKLDNELLDRDLYAARTGAGMELVDRRKAARPLLRTLEQKGVVVLLMDQAVQQQEGILVPFLGRPAWTTPAPAKLALRFNSPIVYVFVYPDGEKWRIEISEPMIPADLPREKQTAEALTELMNDVISDRIRRHPELWLWMHNRWKGTSS